MRIFKPEIWFLSIGVSMSEQEKIPTIGGIQQESNPAELAWAFPDVAPGQAPFGGRVIVQLRRIKKNV
jgi:hypothetical protein